MKKYFTLILLFAIIKCPGQSAKTDVLTIGTFHFKFHNRDIQKTSKNDQIDVLDKKYQAEIEDIVRQIVNFKPTIIAIEQDPENQSKIDSLYNSYRNGQYTLSRAEEEQIGFRVAKRLGLQKLYCVNDWGRNYKNIDSLLDNDTIALKKFKDYFYKNPDTSKTYITKDIFKEKGIKAELRMLNSEEHEQKDLGNYLISMFKYQPADDKFWGADFVTGWWFNRNLRIFRNIQTIKTGPQDKILVIFGAGHMNLLNLFFRVSPEYKLAKASDYLK